MKNENPELTFLSCARVQLLKLYDGPVSKPLGKPDGLKNFLTPRQNYQRSTPHERGHRGESSSLSSKIELLVVYVCTVQEEFSSDIGV